jgi:threonylcarbamoyladenosine tRNA methylthiotransferase MtaB
LDLIDKINDAFELPFIGSDVIAGFAGETDDDFSVTCENLKKSGLSQIHTFPYSIRQGTVGASMPNQVDDSIKEYRANVIKAISRQKYEEFIKRNIGAVNEILIEKHPDKRSACLKGVTRNFLTVILNSQNLDLVNTLAYVKINNYKDGVIYGDLIEH